MGSWHQREASCEEGPEPLKIIMGIQGLKGIVGRGELLRALGPRSPGRKRDKSRDAP